MRNFNLFLHLTLPSLCLVTVLDFKCIAQLNLMNIYYCEKEITTMHTDTFKSPSKQSFTEL